MEYADNNRWDGVERDHAIEDVQRIRGTLKIKYTIADYTSKVFWHLLNNEPYINALGALTGHQAVQQVEAGLKAIYVSGWQVAADQNSAGATYPDQSLYPVNSVPLLVERINNGFQRMDQMETMNGKNGMLCYAPIVADAEAGFGGNLNAYELMQHLVKAGAAAVHFEDQLASAKKCGHLGGKTLINRSAFIEKLKAARLAADVMAVPTIIIARTDALSAFLLTTDIDDEDKAFCTGERTHEGFFRVTGGMDAAISRALSYAPYCDMLWFETDQPSIEQARMFADAIHARYPGKLLAYNCSPSFNWKKKLDDKDIAKFQAELGEMGYKFQFVTLAGFHTLNYSMFALAKNYAASGMTAYAELQEAEFEAEKAGYRAAKHQKFVGTSYFDEVARIVSSGKSSLGAMSGSTETEQFH